MITITNNLATHLVVPNGVGEKLPLKIAPKGEAKVEKITASLKDAETKGLVAIGYPAADKPVDKPAKAVKPKEE